PSTDRSRSVWTTRWAAVSPIGHGHSGEPWSVDRESLRASRRADILVRPMTYVIAEPCIGTKDASCVDVCPVDCIYEGEDMYYIHPGECIDCGACEPECPVQAIFPDTDVPPEWTSYIEKNRTHF